MAAVSEAGRGGAGAAADGKTFWDFTLIDPMTVDFLEATKGHSVILNFSTIPQWMYKTDKPVGYPADPNEPVWNYEQGTDLRDPSGKEVGELQMQYTFTSPKFYNVNAPLMASGLLGPAQVIRATAK